MKLSIVIPVYNVAPYLERCVSSVLRQSFRDYEVILVDSEKCTDSSCELCQRIASEHSGFRVIRQEEPGLAGARNTGIRYAEGEFIIFLDGDDYWLLDDGLEQLFDGISPETDLVVFKSVDIWDQERRIYSSDFDLETINSLPDTTGIFDYLVKTQQFSMSACVNMARMELLKKNEIFFPVGVTSEDVFWSLHLWQHVKRVCIKNLDFYGYCHRPGSLSTVPSIWMYESYDRIFAYWKEQCRLGCVNAAAILSYLADMWVSRGYGYCMIDKKDKPAALAVLKRHKDLLRHSCSRKARRAARLVNMFGVTVAAELLGIYWRVRRTVKSDAV